MKAKPVTARCQRSFDLRTHVCFGISPFNSYFSESKMAELARWGRAHFDSMHFFIPDAPSAYTLQALGYTPEKAEVKARQQGNYTRNKLVKALVSCGNTLPQAYEMIADWSVVSQSSRFSEIHRRVVELYETNASFQAGCLEASRWVLEKRVNEDEISDVMLKQAVRYFLAELPLFLDTPGILGQSASVFAYHQCIPFLERLYQGAYPTEVSALQGFVVIEPQTVGQSRPLLETAISAH